MKITTAKGHELVADQILLQIQEGHWKPGQRLPSVVELAVLYGVGRSTIREAISALKAMRWLDVRQGGGTFVKMVLPKGQINGADMLFQNADSLMELLEVRKALEVEAASLAAVRRSSNDLVHLQELLHVMERGIDSNDLSESERADAKFHMAIAKASDNSLLIQLMESLSDRFASSIRQSRELWFYSEKATSTRLLDEHRMIYEAIERQDRQLAEKLMTEHLLKVVQVLQDVLSEG